MGDAALQTTCRWCGRSTDHSLEARAIVVEVAQEHRIPVNDIYSRGRKGHIAAARACAIRRIYNELNLSSRVIAEEVFGLDHSTVIHHLNGNGTGARAAATSGRV